MSAAAAADQGVVDVVVVGAGPAGLAAASAAAAAGASVTLVDSASRLGGQIWRQPAYEAGGPAPAPPAGPTLPARYRNLGGDGSVEFVLGLTVWSAVAYQAGFALRLEGGRVQRCKALVLATGASELVLPFPGWDLPGVITAGAAQALLKSQGLAPGKKVLVAGNGPFLLPVAASLVEAGVEVAAVVAAATAGSALRTIPALVSHRGKLAEAASYAAHLARRRVRVITGSAVIRAAGNGSLERTTVARLDHEWRPRPGTERSFEVDALAVSFGFVPRLEIARQLEASDRPADDHPGTAVAIGSDMATSVPGLYAAGELTGVGGADLAELEGRIAGHSAAVFAGTARGPALPGAGPAAELARARRFARSLDPLWRLNPGWMSWLEPSTVVCRCEDVSWGQVSQAIHEGARSLRALRGLTRCGMGYCQGRTCGPALQLALATRTGNPLAEVGDFHSRPVAVPVPLGEVIG